MNTYQAEKDVDSFEEDSTTPLLRLNANEGPKDKRWFPLLNDCKDAEDLRVYPNPRSLEAAIAAMEGVGQDALVVGTGGDDILERLVRIIASDNKTAIIHTPTFEMIERYVDRYDVTTKTLPWRDGAFPVRTLETLLRGEGETVFLVTPNNPTGLTIADDIIVDLATRFPNTEFVVDQAYIDFVDERSRSSFGDFDNIVIVKTFSKSWGLAGLRVGYAIARKDRADRIRETGCPYPISGIGASFLSRALSNGLRPDRNYIEAIRRERRNVESKLRASGFTTTESEANFVFAESSKTSMLEKILAAMGIVIRTFPYRRGMEDTLRLTCPGNSRDYIRLEEGLDLALNPEAILFDMDGVLADVTGSYRQCIKETARAFNVRIEDSDIEAAKKRGNANDDYQLTQRLMEERGTVVALEEVIREFDRVYLGDENTDGLFLRETLIPKIETLIRLAELKPIAIVTGRPERDAIMFLDRFNLGGLFDVVITAESTVAKKPAADPVLAAKRALGVERVWMIGDTLDDITAASSAGALPLYFAPTSKDPQRSFENAVTVSSLTQVEEFLQ